MKQTDINWSVAYRRLCGAFHQRSQKIHTDTWQGVDISKKPEMVSYELLNEVICVNLPTENLDHYRMDVKPNLPWADDHFEERVCGQPLNPGVQWANWPWASSADKFRDGGQFNHTYMERYWPKFANRAVGVAKGIRYEYGDLNDLVQLLVKDPLTRQAWIPIFFPEDTGIGDGGRKPCSLGYQFIRRNGFLHVYYPLRSCDLIRHWRDDVYLTIRLLLWVLGECRKQDSKQWDGVIPGTMTMHCTSLHIFQNDWSLIS